MTVQELAGGIPSVVQINGAEAGGQIEILIAPPYVNQEAVVANGPWRSFQVYRGYCEQSGGACEGEGDEP